MRVELDLECQALARAIGRERYRQNRQTWQMNFNRSSEEKDSLDIIGAFGELVVAIGFKLDINQIVWDKPGKDTGGIDFVLPSGKTLQVKTPLLPLRDFKVPGLDKSKFGEADYGVLVDYYPPNQAVIFGWVSREDFMKKAVVFDFLPNPCYGIYRVDMIPVGDSIPWWVRNASV